MGGNQAREDIEAVPGNWRRLGSTLSVFSLILALSACLCQPSLSLWTGLPHFCICTVGHTTPIVPVHSRHLVPWGHLFLFLFVFFFSLNPWLHFWFHLCCIKSVTSFPAMRMGLAINMWFKQNQSDATRLLLGLQGMKDALFPTNFNLGVVSWSFCNFLDIALWHCTNPEQTELRNGDKDLGSVILGPQINLDLYWVLLIFSLFSHKINISPSG